MIKVAVFTSTRAEYGLLYWLIASLQKSSDFDLQLVVTGTHLSYEYGHTIDEIIRDGFTPTISIPVLISDDSPQSVTKSGALLAISLADYFARERPDYFVVLGDRTELLAATQAALIAKVPIVHIHGGEITEGAVDEKVRHAVTKMATLHFTSTDAYRKRVIQMGEDPADVVTCGALGLESIKREGLPDIEELSTETGGDLAKGYFLVLYHPETNKHLEDIGELLSVLEDYPLYKKVIIYPNADVMSRGIIEALERYRERSPETVYLMKSASRRTYLGLMKHCAVYIGNSSSGIIEMPSFHRPIINIGDRQKGRIRSRSTFDVIMDRKQIGAAIERALSTEFQEELPLMGNPYEGAAPSATIVDVLRHRARVQPLAKRFLDLDYKL